MTAPNLDRVGRSTAVAELVGGARDGGAVGCRNSDVYGAAAGRAGDGDLGIRDDRYHRAHSAEVNFCGASETAAADSDAVTPGPGTGSRGDAGDLR